MYEHLLPILKLICYDCITEISTPEVLIPSDLRFCIFTFEFDSLSCSINFVERQAGNHLEGVPFYGPRSDISGPEISNRLLGSKRSNSDSTFKGSSRDGVPHTGPDSLESLHLMKV